MDSKKLFSKIKTELERQKASLKYFTYAFFTTYINDLKNVKNAIRNGATNAEAWNDAGVYSTKFYQQNSSAYCLFLEAYNTKTAE